MSDAPLEQRFGAAVARGAHNPEVRGSKPRIAISMKKNHSARTVPEWSPTSVLGKPNDPLVHDFELTHGMTE